MSPAASPGEDMARVVRTLLSAAREAETSLARRIGVGSTDAAALGHLVEAADPLGPVELGNRLGIRSASSTALVDRLEASGHLRRERNAEDHRRVALHTTESARGQVREALGPLLLRIHALAEDRDETERAVIVSFLQELTSALHAYATEGATGSSR
ncbi:MAG: MarR family winged helix-turn-helix transcriptional regulator [Nocardioidaceae bacterium]